MAVSSLCFESEKKAISAPEINAEQINKTNNDIICKSTCQLNGAKRNKLMGSGSN
jgi:hypothetical protein